MRIQETTLVEWRLQEIHGSSFETGVSVGAEYNI